MTKRFGDFVAVDHVDLRNLGRDEIILVPRRQWLRQVHHHENVFRPVAPH